jgi:tetratricopeptide (TPR) repeat protein
MIPQPPSVFKGRDDVVKQIVNHLTSEAIARKRVCICGPNGAGKTSTALTVMHHPAIICSFEPIYRFWIPCTGLTSPMSFLSYLATVVGIELDTPAQALSAIKSALDTDHPCLLLFDNFGATWDPVEGHREEIAHILHELESVSSLCILMTMRLKRLPDSRWRTFMLGSVEPEDAVSIYAAIDLDGATDPALSELLEVTGRLPYAITLTASDAHQSTATPSDLLMEWNSTGNSEFTSNDLRQRMYRVIELSVQRMKGDQFSEAFELLQILSMLATGIFRRNLSVWTNGRPLSSLRILRDRALVICQSINTSEGRQEYLNVHPIVRSYMRQNGRISLKVREDVYDACRRMLLSFLSKFNSSRSSFQADIAMFRAHESNIYAFVTTKLRQLKEGSSLTPAQEWIGALRMFLRYLERRGLPQLAFFEEVAGLLSEVNPGSLDEASTQFQLANQYFKSNTYEKAIEHYEQARTFFDQLGRIESTLACEKKILQCQQSYSISSTGFLALLDDGLQQLLERQDGPASQHTSESRNDNMLQMESLAEVYV